MSQNNVQDNMNKFYALPEVPFRITSSYSYFEEFEFLRQFSKKQNMIKKKYQLNRNEKFGG